MVRESKLKRSAGEKQKKAEPLLKDQPVNPAVSEEENQSNASKLRAFYIAGIGASAGGLDALKEFLKNLPQDSGIAYVVIAHLAPDYKSIMGQLLQKHTRMKVFEAEDKIQVKPNCVYIIPPGKEMSILHGRLQLLNPARENEIRYPIDFFLRSLALDQGEYAIGIILSGTGTDGTQGVEDIKSEGGLVIVQDSADALFTGMPISAVETGMADYVLSAKEIPQAIIDYIRHSMDLKVRKIKEKEVETTNELKKIFVLIRNEVGLDFTQYKPDHLIRGIQKQMSMHRIPAIEDYIRFLRINPDEVVRLSKALLIKVTRFFRDDFAFESLKKKALPVLTKGKDKKIPLRVWVPGCSTGEEAYSIAILLREYMDEIQVRFAVQIFATDVDSEFIEQARAGHFPESITDDVSPKRLERFFDKTGAEYKIKDDIRSMVIFAAQDLVKGPTFMRLDLISCRNILIYMGLTLQKKLIPLFHYCLIPGGFLFLGSSETIGSFVDLFSAMDNKARIFQAKKVKSPPLPKSMRSIQIPVNSKEALAEAPLIPENESAGELLDRALLRIASYPAGNAITNTIRGAVADFVAKNGNSGIMGTEIAATTELAGLRKPFPEMEQVRLEVELKETRERLQTTIEELETSNEELRSSNEELESVNEELLTLNAEFQNKIDELADAHANMDILLAGAQIATIFLGTNLIIRSFTPSITGIINLLTSDIGRSLRDFSSHLQYPNMIAEIERVITTGNPEEKSIRHENGSWYMVRILPYRKKGRLEGAAITFIDISEQKRAMQKIQDALTYANGIIETVREPLVILNGDLRVITCNRSFYRTFKVSKAQTEKKLIYALGNKQWNIPELKRLLEEILPQRSTLENYLVEHNFEDIGPRKILLNARQIMQEDEGMQMILLAMEDITDKEKGSLS